MGKKVLIFRLYEPNGILDDEDTGEKYNVLVAPAEKAIVDTNNKTVTLSLEYMEETLKLKPFGEDDQLFIVGNTRNYWMAIEDEKEVSGLVDLYEDFIETPDSSLLIGADNILGIWFTPSGIKYIIQTDTGITSMFWSKDSEGVTKGDGAAVADRATDDVYRFYYQRPPEGE